MKALAREHPNSRIESDPSECYGVFVETEHYEYDIRMNVDMGTYDFYIYCADKRVQPSQFLNSSHLQDENLEEQAINQSQEPTMNL